MSAVEPVDNIDLNVSGLEPNPVNATALHQPHQQIQTGGERYLQVFNFDTPAFDKNNRVFMSSVPMVVHDMVVELDLSAATGPTTPAVIQLQTGIGAAGAQLLYKNSSVYNASEAELLSYQYKNNAPSQLIRKLIATNDTSDATRQTQGGARNLYYIDLAPLANILTQVGPLGSYAANTWSVDLSLLPLNKWVTGGSSTAGVLTINSMKLMLSGHRESPANMERVNVALGEGGVMFNFPESNFSRLTYGASASSFTTTLSAIEGMVSSIVLMNRTQAGIDGTAPDAVDHLAFQLFNNPLDTVEIGRVSNPVELFGQQITEKMLRLMHENESYDNGNAWIDADGARREPSVIAIPLAERESLDQKHGVHSGSWRVKNDLRIKYNFTTTTTANYIDILVYVLRKAVVKHSGFVINNV